MTVRRCASCLCWIPVYAGDEEYGFFCCLDEYACLRRSQDDVAMAPRAVIESYEVPVD